MGEQQCRHKQGCRADPRRGRKAQDEGLGCRSQPRTLSPRVPRAMPPLRLRVSNSGTAWDQDTSQSPGTAWAGRE